MDYYTEIFISPSITTEAVVCPFSTLCQKRKDHLSLLSMSNTPLPLSTGLQIRKGSVLVVAGEVLDIREGHSRDEALGLVRLGDLEVELVDLFERKTLGLVDVEVDECSADDAEATPDEEDLGLEVGVAWARVDHVRGRVGDGEVEEPVGGSGDGESLGANLQGEDLTGDDPGARTPGAGEEEDVDADEDNEDLVCNERVGGGTDDGDEELAESHANGTHQKERATTPLLNEVETGEGGDRVDDVGGHGDEEGVLDTGGLEEGGTVVDWSITN